METELPAEIPEGSDTDEAGSRAHPRIFLVVVDDTTEHQVALRYACLRVRKSGGRIALLMVYEPTEFLGWRAVEERMRAARRDDAERIMLQRAEEVWRQTGTFPVLYIREGNRRDEILALLNEEPSICVLVLAAGTGPKGPGPLISYFTASGLSKLKVPLAIVPGTLTDADMDAIT